MRRAFYEIIPDPRPQGAYLSEPLLHDGTRVFQWDLMQGVAYNSHGILNIPALRAGSLLDISMTPLRIWVVRPSVGVEFAQYASPDRLQRISALFEDGTELEVLNPLALVDCFDHERSEGIQYFGEGDGRSRLGQVKWAARWLIDPDRAGDHHIFRVKDDHVAMIVSEDIKIAIQMRGFSGVMFKKVTP